MWFFLSALNGNYCQSGSITGAKCTVLAKQNQRLSGCNLNKLIYAGYRRIGYYCI